MVSKKLWQCTMCGQRMWNREDALECCGGERGSKKEKRVAVSMKEWKSEKDAANESWLYGR